MNHVSKSLLAASLVMTAVGLFVSFAHTAMSPAWSLFLPYGVIFFGLFLIHWVFQKEFAAYDREKLTGMHSSQHRENPPPEKDLPAEATMAPHRPAYG